MFVNYFHSNLMNVSRAHQNLLKYEYFLCFLLLLTDMRCTVYILYIRGKNTFAVKKTCPRTVVQDNYVHADLHPTFQSCFYLTSLF